MNTEGKQFEVLKWVAVIVAIFIIIKLLNKFNLFGKDQAQKDAEALGQSAGLTKPVQQQSEMQKAIKRKLGTSKPTKEQLKGLLPNFNNYPAWVKEIYGAKHAFGNEIEPVMNVFRQMNSQFEINYFSQLFAQTTKKDLYGYLKKLFTGVLGNADRMQDIYAIVRDKPMV